MMTTPTPAISPSFDEPYRGQSDEEELKRITGFYENQGVGEVLVDYDADLDELGLRAE